MGTQGVQGSLYRMLLPALLAGLMVSSTKGAAQERADTDTAEISLRKTIAVREYKGHEIDGNERDVRPGDTMWHILIRERGLAPEHFKEYFVLVRGLNPNIKTPEILQVGDKIFIPVKPDEVLRLQPASGNAKGAARISAETARTLNYTVKPGDHLYQILRTHLGIVEDRKLWQYFALVKDLNPQKSDWDVIEKGETIMLPVVGAESENPTIASKVNPIASAVAQPAASKVEQPRKDAPKMETPMALASPPRPKADSRTVGLDYARRLSAREHFSLIGMVAESLGNEVQSSGEEIVALKDSSIRLDKNKFPVVYNPALDQRVILDGEDKIPDSLRANLKQQSAGTPVVSVAKNTTVQEAVGQLLARLGYQALPAERPVVVHEAGVSFEAQGQWVVTAPEQSNKPQEIVIINLHDGTGEFPEYLRTHLGEKGLHLKTVSLKKNAARDLNNEGQEPLLKGQIKNLPREKSDMVDALLQQYQVPFGVKEAVSVELRDGLRVDITADRTFEFRGHKKMIFFRSIDPAVKTALEAKQDTKSIELDVAALKSREIIAKLLGEFGERAPYEEHRFSAANGSLKNRLMLTADGFYLPARSLFVTDREIPVRFQRVFFEKGLDIVYFQ